MKNQLVAAITNTEALVQLAQENYDAKRRSLLSAMEADMNRSEGSGAQEARHDKYMQEIRNEEESAEKSLENAKRALHYLKSI